MLGMNTNALFAPTSRMYKAILETKETGLSRIEISYYAESRLSEDLLLSDEFPDRMIEDLDKVQDALNKVS